MSVIFKEFSEEKWEQVRVHPYFAEYRKALFERAEEYLCTEPPIIKFSLIHRYVVDGNREEFEKVHIEYFARMHVYFAAYMLSNDERYISPLADIIWNICDFESWSIPAHVGEHLPIDERRTNLDLCSTIAAHQLSDVIKYVGDKLPALVVKRAKAEIRYRIIDSYAVCRTKKRYWWPTAKNNWSAVCIASILGTYINEATPEEIERELPGMIESARCYLDGFTDDGCCGEGYAYWNYGFSYFVIFAQLLREYTDGKIDMFKEEKVARIARFQESVPLNERECVSFSDATIEFYPTTWLTHFLKGVYPDLRIPALKADPDPEAPPRQILWQNPEMEVSSLNAAEPTSFSFPIAQWFIFRSNAYAFGCKAGHNQEQHNHNDVGSFLFAKGNGVAFCDPGVGQYTKQYFSDARYELMLCSSRGHSVPIINGKYQSTLGEIADIYAHEDDRYAFSMEKVYEVDTLKSLKRDFVCEADGVSLTDTYLFTEDPESVVERFISLKGFTVEEGRLVSDDAVMIFDPALFDVTLGSEVVERKKGRTGTVYYADLTVKAPEKNMTLKFKFL